MAEAKVGTVSHPRTSHPRRMSIPIVVINEHFVKATASDVKTLRRVSVIYGKICLREELRAVLHFRYQPCDEEGCQGVEKKQPDGQDDDGG
jgi:hypothetical protein